VSKARAVDVREQGQPPRGGKQIHKPEPLSNMKKLLTLAVSAAVAVSVFAGEFPDITIKDLRTAIEAKKVTVIDVNGRGSWRKGRIPTAIDFASHKNDLAKVLPKDRSALVVAYCTGPT